MIKKGWAEKLDKSAIPNMKNLVAVQQHPASTRTATTACRGSPA